MIEKVETTTTALESRIRQTENIKMQEVCQELLEVRPLKEDQHRRNTIPMLQL